MTSKWRELYKVHPAADVFPMMDDEELAALGEDIKKNGQTMPIILWEKDGSLIDGRNRLEAVERMGLQVKLGTNTHYRSDPVPYVISLNIHRRHLTKQQQADLIVLAIKASRQDGEVPKERHVKGKAGSEKDPVKAAAVAAGAEHGISQRTVERSIAKAEGRVPARTAEKIKTIYPVDDDPDGPGFDPLSHENRVESFIAACEKAVSWAEWDDFTKLDLSADEIDTMIEAARMAAESYITCVSLLEKKPRKA